MAKPKAKAKKKVVISEPVVKPKSAAKLKREIDNFIDEMAEVAHTREKWVQMILAVNDESIDGIVKAMCDSLYRMSVGNATPDVSINYKGQIVKARDNDERDRIIGIANRNRRWVAVRILVASAEQDIQIGNFKMPKGKCARCGKKPVKPTKPVKVVKKKVTAVKKKISKPSKKVKK